MIIGETIRLLRSCKKLKQKAVANSLKISQPAYSKLEKSKHITEERLERVLKAINCTKEDLDAMKKFLSTTEIKSH
jgi:transcriptional regulator with XRE-family HTH domain